MTSPATVAAEEPLPAVDRGPFVCAAKENGFTVICRTSIPSEKLALCWRKAENGAFSSAPEVSAPGGRDHVFKAVGAPLPEGKAEFRIVRDRDRKPLDILPAEGPTEEPYLFNPGETTLSVGWKSAASYVGAVEYRPAGSKESRIAAERTGGTLHTLHLSGLPPGTRCEYRILKTDPASGSAISAGAWRSFSTLKDGMRGCRMVFFSDIHADKETFSAFISHLKPETADFVVLAGDLCWDGIYESGGKPFFGDFLNLAVSRFADRVPTVFMRGNHEWGGDFRGDWAKFFPSENGRTYGAFKAGCCFFIVLDTGPIGNFAPGTPAGDLIAEQRRWLENSVMKSAAFRASRFKIVLAHMPTHGIPNAPLLEKSFSDLLNRGGVQLMITGHVHRYLRIDRNDNGCRGTDYYSIWSENDPPRTAEDKNYTLVINGGGPDENGKYATALEMTATAENLRLRVIGKDGTRVDEFRILPDGKTENIFPAPRFPFRGKYKP